MPAPGRDREGRIHPYDDPDIADADTLIRFVPPHQLVREADGRWRLSSGAFSPSSGPMGGISVELESRILAAGIEPLSRLPSPAHGAVRLIAGELRRLGLLVGSDPIDGNPYHAQIWGATRQSLRRRIRDLAKWICKPRHTGDILD